MVTNDVGHIENYAAFGVIFAFICLFSGLFSCIISVTARRKAKKKFEILPQFQSRDFLARKYSEVSTADTHILY